MQPAQNLRLGDVISRRGRCADKLNYEGEDVEQDEIEAEAPGFDFEEACRGSVVVDHAAENHVDEGVSPEGRD